jgi:hypothetical protein
MRNVVLLGLMLLGLGGCGTPDFAASCRRYGFSPGMDAFATCMTYAERAHRQRLATLAAEL